MGSVFFCGFFQFVMMLAGFYQLDFALNSLILFHNMQSKIGSLGFDDDFGVWVWWEIRFFSVRSFHAW